MRGKVKHVNKGGGTFRITPAYAGKSFRRLSRVRCRSRITPAYAGKRKRPVVKWGRCWDHPRLCGEKHFPLISA